MFVFMKRIFSLFVVVLVLLYGCVTAPIAPTTADHAYGYFDDGSLLGRYAPIIAPQQTALEYNRIGHAAARLDEGGNEEIYINTDQPVIYTQEQDFTTARGNRYRNLIYRFHFSEVPQWNLTAGKNGGLFVVITLNEKQQPVLITTVHSCGCYLAMVPTSYLDVAAYPEKWDVKNQEVYGETLPGRLDYPATFSSDLRPLIALRSATHRVMDVAVVNRDQYGKEGSAVQLLSADALEHLPLGKGETSFFYPSGPDKGYVKGTFKPWEFLWMSWWSLDRHVGIDKRLGDPAETGTVFYTSLKPWAREASNMWFFADFLEYWGWRL